MEPERSCPASAEPVPNEALNGMLREVVLYLLDKGPHANFFRNAVSSVVVDDYREHVPADQEMYLSKILARTEAQRYDNVASFRADFQLMYDNAAAYNGRNGGRHAYEPVIHWAGDMLAAAEKELQQRTQLLSEAKGEQVEASPPHHAQLDASMTEAGATDSIAAPAEPVVAAASPAEQPAGGSQALGKAPPASQCDDNKQQSQQQQQQGSPKPESQDHGRLRDQGQQPVCENQDEHMQHLLPVQQPVSAAGQSSPRPANVSTGQQSSSPSSGSGDGSRSGLEALLAACELAAEQDSTGPGTCGGAAIARAGASVPERRSYPGCGDPQQQQPQQQQQTKRPQGTDAAQDGTATGSLSLSRQHCHDEDPAGSSEGGGMALCGGRNGGAGTGANCTDLVVSTVQPGGRPGSNDGGGAGPGGSYLASNAFKNRRHKSKVYIKPNKVVYLPTTFVEEEFDVTALPLDCELRVEADGVLTDESFRVTIKAVPRQGLSTMYCMTNVMRFQQQYLNWQIYNWTRIDNTHIKIHLQSPSPSQTQLQRPELDRAASLPEHVGRNFASGRGSEDGAMGYGQGWGQGPRGPAPSSSLKRKSDTGRYNVTRVERRLVPEPGRELPVELRLSSTNYLQYPSPIPESPPDSPQRRISACLPPRAPSHGMPTAGYRHNQIHIHNPSGHYQGPQQVYHQQQLHHNALAPPFSLPQQQPQRGSNSSIGTKQETCSEDSSGPVAVPEAAVPLPLTWHPAGSARPPRPGGGNGARGGAPAPLLTAAGLQSLELTQQVHELAEQLQLQAQAAGSELHGLAALQLAMAALQQQQQHQLIAPQAYKGVDGVAALDLSSTADQELLLQHLTVGTGLLPQQHVHQRGHRASGGTGYTDLHTLPMRRGSADGAADLSHEAAAGLAGALARGAGFSQHGPCNSGSGEQFPQQPSGAHPGEQQRRSSHGDRSRSVARQLQDVAQRQQQQQLERAIADAAIASAPSGSQEMEPRGGGGVVAESNEGDEVHQIVCHPRRSGSGNGPIGGAGRIFTVAPCGGRILLEVGGVAGGPAGPRISGSGSGTVRRIPLGAGMAPQQAGLTFAGLPNGLDLSECSPADILSYLSPSKRFKVAVSTDNANAAAVAAAAAAVVGGELSVLDVLNFKAAAGALSVPPEAALAAALRQGAGGSAAATFPHAAALGGRPFLPISPELMGQLL